MGKIYKSHVGSEQLSGGDFLPDHKNDIDQSISCPDPFNEDIVSSYIENIGRTPLLKPEEERRLTRLARKGDREARRKMIQANLRLVVYIARQYQNRGLDLPDLLSEGNIGLMRALDKYEPERGFRFSTYATFWIKQEILRAIMNHGRLIRLPIYVGQSVNQYLAALNQMERLGNLWPSMEEVANYMGQAVEVIQHLPRWNVRISSLDVPLEGAPDEALKDASAIDPPDEIQHRKVTEQVKRLLNRLSAPQREVIFQRYGLGGSDTATFDEIGASMHLSCARVRQIHKEALTRLKKLCSHDDVSLEDFF